MMCRGIPYVTTVDTWNDTFLTSGTRDAPRPELTVTHRLVTYKAIRESLTLSVFLAYLPRDIYPQDQEQTQMPYPT